MISSLDIFQNHIVIYGMLLFLPYNFTFIINNKKIEQNHPVIVPFKIPSNQCDKNIQSTHCSDTIYKYLDGNRMFHAPEKHAETNVKPKCSKVIDKNYLHGKYMLYKTGHYDRIVQSTHSQIISTTNSNYLQQGYGENMITFAPKNYYYKDVYGTKNKILNTTDKNYLHEHDMYHITTTSAPEKKSQKNEHVLLSNIIKMGNDNYLYHTTTATLETHLYKKGQQPICCAIIKISKKHDAPPNYDKAALENHIYNNEQPFIKIRNNALIGNYHMTAAAPDAVAYKYELPFIKISNNSALVRSYHMTTAAPDAVAYKYEQPLIKISSNNALIGSYHVTTAVPETAMEISSKNHLNGNYYMVTAAPETGTYNHIQRIIKDSNKENLTPATPENHSYNNNQPICSALIKISNKNNLLTNYFITTAAPEVNLYQNIQPIHSNIIQISNKIDLHENPGNKHFLPGISMYGLITTPSENKLYKNVGLTHRKTVNTAKKFNLFVNSMYHTASPENRKYKYLKPTRSKMVNVADKYYLYRNYKYNIETKNQLQKNIRPKGNKILNIAKTNYLHGKSMYSGTTVAPKFQLHQNIKPTRSRIIKTKNKSYMVKNEMYNIPTISVKDHHTTVNENVLLAGYLYNITTASSGNSPQNSNIQPTTNRDYFDGGYLFEMTTAFSKDSLLKYMPLKFINKNFIYDITTAVPENHLDKNVQPTCSNRYNNVNKNCLYAKHLYRNKIAKLTNKNDLPRKYMYGITTASPENGLRGNVQSTPSRVVKTTIKNDFIKKYLVGMITAFSKDRHNVQPTRSGILKITNQNYMYDMTTILPENQLYKSIQSTHSRMDNTANKNYLSGKYGSMTTHAPEFQLHKYVQPTCKVTNKNYLLGNYIYGTSIAPFENSLHKNVQPTPSGVVKPTSKDYFVGNYLFDKTTAFSENNIYQNTQPAAINKILKLTGKKYIDDVTENQLQKNIQATRNRMVNTATKNYLNGKYSSIAPKFRLQLTRNKIPKVITSSENALHKNSELTRSTIMKTTNKDVQKYLFDMTPVFSKDSFLQIVEHTRDSILKIFNKNYMYDKTTMVPEKVRYKNVQPTRSKIGNVTNRNFMDGPKNRLDQNMHPTSSILVNTVNKNYLHPKYRTSTATPQFYSIRKIFNKNYMYDKATTVPSKGRYGNVQPTRSKIGNVANRNFMDHTHTVGPKNRLDQNMHPTSSILVNTVNKNDLQPKYRISTATPQFRSHKNVQPTRNRIVKTVNKNGAFRKTLFGLTTASPKSKFHKNLQPTRSRIFKITNKNFVYFMTTSAPKSSFHRSSQPTRSRTILTTDKLHKEYTVALENHSSQSIKPTNSPIINSINTDIENEVEKAEESWDTYNNDIINHLELLMTPRRELLRKNLALVFPKKPSFRRTKYYQVPSHVSTHSDYSEEIDKDMEEAGFML